MKKYIFILIAFTAITLNVAAQPKGKFDPNRFKTELHAYIAKEVRLTEAEQAKFFPIWDEMMDKKRAIFVQIKRLHHQQNITNIQAKQNILRCDLLESRLKQIERNYHLRMLNVLPAAKLFYVFKAERRFHRQTLQNFCTQKQEAKGYPQK